MDCEISTDPGRIDVDMVYAFLTESYWAKDRPKSVVEKSIEHSLCFGAYIGDKQVGFARWITDRAVFAFLADVFVLPEYRGRGIGKALVSAAMEHDDIQNLKVMVLGTKDAHGLYEQFGFRRFDNPERLMACFAAETGDRV